MGVRKCSELRKDEQVVFMRYSSLYENDIPEYGNVIYVDEAQKNVAVVYLDGYRSESTFVPFYKMLAVYDPNGEYMEFGNIKGRSQLLNAE